MDEDYVVVVPAIFVNKIVSKRLTHEAAEQKAVEYNKAKKPLFFKARVQDVPFLLAQLGRYL